MVNVPVSPSYRPLAVGDKLVIGDEEYVIEHGKGSNYHVRLRYGAQHHRFFLRQLAEQEQLAFAEYATSSYLSSLSAEAETCILAPLAHLPATSTSPSFLLYSVLEKNATQLLQLNGEHEIKGILLSLSKALSIAHQAGFAHGNVCLGNMFEVDGHWMLGGWGYASRKRKGVPMGQDAYLSPEGTASRDLQDRGINKVAVAAEGDVWAFGVTVLELILGRRLWRKANVEDEDFKRFFDEPTAAMFKTRLSAEAISLLAAVFRPAHLRVDVSSLVVRARGVSLWADTREESAGDQDVQRLTKMLRLSKLQYRL